MARILLAEDDEALRALCARALTTDGHEVSTASDGAEALEVIGSADANFDLLLTDIRMPIIGRHCFGAFGRARPSGTDHSVDDGLCG